MRRTLPLVITLIVIVVGALMLKGFSDTHTSNPTASIMNGAPRGLLGLGLLLADQGRTPVVVAHFEDARDEAQEEAGDDVKRPPSILIPPPESSKWTEDEAKVLLQRVEAGARVLILCDDESARNDRLEPLLDAVGVDCYRADIPIGDTVLQNAMGELPGYAHKLHVRGAGRVRPHEMTAAFGAWLAGADAVVVKRVVGAGVVTVMGTATVLANDGIATADNAAFALSELQAPVVVDERHHGSRASATILTAASRGTGPPHRSPGIAAPRAAVAFVVVAAAR